MLAVSLLIPAGAELAPWNNGQMHQEVQESQACMHNYACANA